jgi:hypothetical protein
MRSGWPRWSRQSAHLARFLVVVLALAGQITAGARATPDDPAIALLRALDRATIFCQSGPTHPPHDVPPLRRGLADAFIVQTSARVAQPAILGTAVFLPPPSPGHAVRLEGLPQARAPPLLAVASAYARGPPGLI